jgi:hypothetical protein
MTPMKTKHASDKITPPPLPSQKLGTSLYDTITTFKCQFTEDNSSKQFKAPILAIWLAI